MLTIKVIHVHTTDSSEDTDKKLDKILANQKAISKQIYEVGAQILKAVGTDDRAEVLRLAKELSDGTDALKSAMDQVSGK